MYVGRGVGKMLDQASGGWSRLSDNMKVRIKNKPRAAREDDLKYREGQEGAHLGMNMAGRGEEWEEVSRTGDEGSS